MEIINVLRYQIPYYRHPFLFRETQNHPPTTQTLARKLF